MVDQPHTEQPPERKAPSEFSSRVLKSGTIVSFAAAAVSTYVGVMFVKDKGIANKLFGAGAFVIAATGIASGIAGWSHANFAGIVRESNRVGDLLLQRTSIDKELVGQSR